LKGANIFQVINILTLSKISAIFAKLSMKITDIFISTTKTLSNGLKHRILANHSTTIFMFDGLKFTLPLKAIKIMIIGTKLVF
jgi:hypothetical protein